MAAELCGAASGATCQRLPGYACSSGTERPGAGLVCARMLRLRALVESMHLDKETPEYRALVQYRGAYILRMLQWVIGDQNFDKLLTRFVQQAQTTPVSTEAFEKLTTEAAGGDLNYFFDQWLNGTGVPEFVPTWTSFRTKFVERTSRASRLRRALLSLHVARALWPQNGNSKRRHRNAPMADGTMQSMSEVFP